MPSHSVPFARNVIRKSLMAIVDSPITNAEKIRVWRHFQSACAYCGKRLIRSKRNGHLDHLVAGAQHGSNDISNYVLACSICNGDERRDMPWEEFLNSKAHGESRETRKVRIREWINNSPRLESRTNPAEYKSIIDQAVKSFDRAVKKMRTIKARQKS